MAFFSGTSGTRPTTTASTPSRSPSRRRGPRRSSCTIRSRRSSSTAESASSATPARSSTSCRCTPKVLASPTTSRTRSACSSAASNSDLGSTDREDKYNFEFVTQPSWQLADWHYLADQGQEFSCQLTNEDLKFNIALPHPSVQS